MSYDVILVDDHSVLRAGIKSFLSENSGFDVKFEASSYEECEKLIENFKNSSINYKNLIAVVDISFSNSNVHHEENVGFEIIKQFSSLGVSCIAFSSHDSGGFIESALNFGAKGFVSKNSEEKILLDALEAVSGGKIYIQPNLVLNLLEVRDIYQTFTKKEKVVADALNLYKSNAAIAKEIGISEKSLCNYISTLYDKTGTENKVQLLEVLGKL